METGDRLIDALRRTPNARATKAATRAGETGLALAVAVVEASTTPLLLLDRHLDVVAASQSFRATFLLDAAPTPQGSVFALGAGE